MITLCYIATNVLVIIQSTHDFLTLKWSLFSSSFFFVRKSWLVFEISKQPNFISVSWPRELSQGKNPREIPFNAEAEVTQMAPRIFSQKIKGLLQDSDARNLQMYINAGNLGQKRNCFQPIWTLQLQIYCLISNYQIIMHVFWVNGSCLVVPGFLGKNGLPWRCLHTSFTSPLEF